MPYTRFAFVGGACRYDHVATTLVARVRIGRDRLEIAVDPKHLSAALGVPPFGAAPETLTFMAPFTLRRRGVETKLLLEGDTIARDETLLRNVARGHAYLEMIISGLTVQQVAEAHTLSARRIQQTLEFAFLSPDVVRQVVEGQQPACLTADWCLKHEIPVDWTAQPGLLSAL